MKSSTFELGLKITVEIQHKHVVLRKQELWVYMEESEEIYS
jgi:hypothetical protein